MEIGCPAWLCSRTSDVRDRRTADYATRHSKLVAREGSAPSTSGCRPDAILFHHRAVLAHCQKLATGAGIAPAFAPSKGAVLRLDDPAIKWWPARVTRPVPRIKSPLHHFNACRPKLVLAAGLAPALATFSTSCLCIGLREQSKWILQPVMLRQDFFTKEIRRLLRGGNVFNVVGMLMPRSPRCCPGRGWLMTPA